MRAREPLEIGGPPQVLIHLLSPRFPELSDGREFLAGARYTTADFVLLCGIDFAKLHEEIIPLPSGGVFAEAVLGRYNAAEKLDLTRFWN